MNRTIRSLAVLAALLAAPAASACGEGMFNSGRGLSYQVYLAPRPAIVLIYDADENPALYAGLERAGHTVTVVRDRSELDAGLARGGFDVVIADADTLLAMPALPARGLPVVPRGRPDTSSLRARFHAVVFTGGGLAQYLKGIHRALSAAQ